MNNRLAKKSWVYTKGVAFVSHLYVTWGAAWSGHDACMHGRDEDICIILLSAIGSDNKLAIIIASIVLCFVHS